MSLTAALGVVHSCADKIGRRAAHWRYDPWLDRARARMEEAADALDEIRLRAETRYATSEAAWQEGPEGAAYGRALDDLREAAHALRTGPLPDVSRL